MQWMPDALIPWHGRWVAASRVVRPCGGAALESPRVCSRCWGCRRVAPRPGCRRSARIPSRPGVGCDCTTGTQDACGDNTLLCCANDPNGPPGGPGTCTPSSVGCNPRGPSSAPCTSRGCRCNSAVQGTCDDGLTCCPDDPGLPGGPGHCVRQDNATSRDAPARGARVTAGRKAPVTPGCLLRRRCLEPRGAGTLRGGGYLPGPPKCQATTNPCPSSCAAGEFCHTCCSGYCGPDDHCGAAACTGVGCGCTAGVENSCSAGLVCCQSQMNAPNAPGGPGMCATPDGCGGGG